MWWNNRDTDKLLCNENIFHTKLKRFFSLKKNIIVENQKNKKIDPTNKRTFIKSPAFNFA